MLSRNMYVYVYLKAFLNNRLQVVKIEPVVYFANRNFLKNLYKARFIKHQDCQG